MSDHGRIKRTANLNGRSNDTASKELKEILGNDDISSIVVSEAAYHHEDEPMLADSSEIETTSGDANVNSNVNKMHCFLKKQIIVLVITGVCLGIAAYFTIHVLIIHAQRYEKQQTDSDKFDFTQGYQLTTVGFQVDGIKQNDSSDNVKYTTSKFPVIARSEWGAKNQKNTLNNLQLPTIRVIIAHTGTDPCLTQASCSSMIRSMQLSHFQRGWADIGYNFLVGGDGSAYIGRGWDKEGVHSPSYNSKSVCIAFIGKFNEIVPPQRQIAAAQKLIEEGLLLGKLASHYRLYGHRQVMHTNSPGDALYAIIKKWNHWSEIVI